MCNNGFNVCEFDINYGMKFGTEILVTLKIRKKFIFNLELYWIIISTYSLLWFKKILASPDIQANMN